jgi:hypothetical protein
MPTPFRAVRTAAAALVVIGGLVVAGCGGGSVNSTPVTQPTTTPAPTVQSIPTGGGALTVNSTGSSVATVAIAPGAPAGVSLTATSSSTFSNPPAISSLARTAAAKPGRSPQDGITGAVPFFFVTFSVSANLPSQFVSGETVSLGTNPPTATYGVAFDDITSTPFTELGTAGPGVVSTTAGTVTFTNGTSANSPVLQAGHTYLIQFFYVPAGTPTPSPTPTGAAPTATPTSAAPTATPTGAAPTATPTSGSSAIPLPAYTFSGGSNTTGCTTSQCSVPISITDTNFNLSFQATVPAPSVGTEVTASVAGGSPEISPTQGFPLYTGTGLAKMYFQLTASPTASFATTPTIVLSGTGLSTSAACIFYGYINNGSGFAWTPVSPQTGAATVTNNSVTLPPVNPGQVSLSSTPFFGAIVCTQLP